MHFFQTYSDLVANSVLHRDSPKRKFEQRLVSYCLLGACIRSIIITISIYFQLDSWLQYDTFAQFGARNDIRDPFFYACFAILFGFITFTNHRIFRTTIETDIWQKLYEITVHNREIFWQKNWKNLRYYHFHLWTWKTVVKRPLFVYRKTKVLYHSLINFGIFPRVTKKKRALKFRLVKYGPRLKGFWFVSNNVRLQSLIYLQIFEYLLFSVKLALGKEFNCILKFYFHNIFS